MAESEFTGSNGSKLFSIPSGDTLTIVHEQALHTWAKSESGGQLILSYEQIKRVCEQMSRYPLRKQWSVDVGNKWTVRRNGDVLLLKEKENDNDIAGGESAENGKPWILFDGIDEDRSAIKRQSQHIVRLSLPSGYNEKNLSLKHVGRNGKYKFVPPWRGGRSPVKIKEFLRAQRVPLHEREFTPILCFADDSDDTVLAVYIPKGQKGNGIWMVHADFETTKDSCTEIHLMQVAE